MARTPRWKTEKQKDGIWTIQLQSWKYFHDYVRQVMLSFNHYVWRGQLESNWQLESSLDRILKKKRKNLRDSLAIEHLEKFKYSARGRRGKNPQILEDDNAWWALGQHFGLATPLLDWSASPFVGLYFAMESNEKSTSGNRVVWALGNIDTPNNKIKLGWKEEGRPPIIEFIKPLQDENDRLVSQSGLFTRSPLNMTVDEWVEKNYKGENKEAALIKILIPEKDRLNCLRTLNKMNINHLTLFPDLYGSGGHCNKELEIDKY